LLFYLYLTRQVFALDLLYSVAWRHYRYLRKRRLRPKIFKEFEKITVMTTYVAFLRGIMPTNPNMRNEKLRMAFEAMGFSNVQTLISSGNVLFESGSNNVSALEALIEKELALRLGIQSPAFVRSKKELEGHIRKDPFKGKEHSKDSYLIVTFTRKKPREIFNVINIAKTSGADFMRDIEKKFGKEVTTRTWKTVERVVKKMDTSH
jgi:uncharacterized protein (DUF1697 family)